MNLLFTAPIAELSPAFVAMLELIPLTAAVVFYWHRAMTLSWAGRPVPVWRQVSFGFGLFLACFVLFNPWGYLAEELVIGHMVEHLIIGDIASLFIVLGLTRSLLQPILAIRIFDRLQVLTNPLVAMPLWAINLFFWHIPALYEAATFDSDLVHALQHLCFFFAGVAFWMSLLGPLPKPSWFTGAASAGFVFAVRLIGAVLANVLMWSSSVIYARYAPGEAAHGISALSDQGLAGVVMMAESTVITLSILTWLVLRWAKHDTERQELLDLAAARGIDLDPARAQRAVTAGQGQRLRERIESGTVHSEASGRA